MLSVTAIFFLSSPLIARALHDTSLTPLFQLSSLIIPAFASASFYFYYYTGLHFFRLQAFLKTTRALGRILFIVSFAYFFGVKGAISGYIVAPIFVFLVALICDIYITHKYFPAVKQTKDEMVAFSSKTILHYAGPLTLFLLFYELILTLDLYFVKSLLGSDYLTGIYNASITVGRIPYYLFYALTIILLPAISKTTAERNTKETENLVRKSMRLLIFLLFPMITLLIIYAPQILTIFYGKEYLEAVVPMSIFAIGVGFLTVFYVLSFALNGAGLVNIPLKLAFFGFLGMIVLNFLLIPTFGLIGASLSTAIISLFLMVSILIYTKTQFHTTFALRTLFFSHISAIVISMLSQYLPSGVYSFLFSGAILFLTYFLILRLCKVLTDEDIKPFRTLFVRS